MQVDDPLFETVKYDIAAVHGNRRTNACVEQLDNLRHNLVVVAIAAGVCGSGGFADDRVAGCEMFHDRAQNRGLQYLPVNIRRLGDGDKIGAQENRGNVVYFEQPRRQRRACRRCCRC